jgi:heat shock protein HtpX
MEHVGIISQIRKNNMLSVSLLIAFPLLLLILAYTLIYFGNDSESIATNDLFLSVLPYIFGFTSVWFIIAWLFHSSMIRLATGSKPLERKDNKRVYNILENLCMAHGITPPRLYIIYDSSLNAFASGISEKNYSISVSSGMLEKLDDAELEAVIAHELTHIRNRDVRFMVISIIFVGVFSFLAEVAFRSLRFAGGGRSKNSKGGGAIVLIAIVVTAICYLLSVLMSYGISRSREYMADAGSAELTKNPHALASALKKISKDAAIEAVENRDVAQLFIENPKPSAHGFSWDNLFATHPPIQKRIEILEQFV